MVVVLGLVACTPASEPDAVPQPSALADRVAASDDLLATALADDEPGCSAAVAVRGEVVWAGARGLANVDGEDPLTTATEFDIASVSKQFTATAVLLLVEDGALALDDPLSGHVAGLPAWAADVTLDDLLHHTSGIPDYTELIVAQGAGLDEPTTQQDAVDAIAGIPTLPQEPGGAFRYSNSNYVLLAEVVRDVTGTTLADVLADRVFGPLGLAMRLDPASTAPAVATAYTADGDAWVPEPSRWTQVGDGSIHTTPSELARWGDQYRTGAVGGRALLDAVEEGSVPTGAPGGSRYGAGIEIASDGALSHLGGWAGYVTVFGVTADRTTSLAMSCNSPDVDADQVAAGLLAVWVG